MKFKFLALALILAIPAFAPTAQARDGIHNPPVPSPVRPGPHNMNAIHPISPTSIEPPTLRSTDPHPVSGPVKP